VERRPDQVFEAEAVPDAAEVDIKTEALTIPVRVSGLAVVDQPSLDMAREWLKKIKEARARIGEVFDSKIAKAHALHKDLVAEKRRFTDGLDRADSIIRPKVADYLAEQDRLRFEELRAAELARKKIEQVADAAVDKAHELVREGMVDEADEVIGAGYAKVEEIKAATPEVRDKPDAENLQTRKLWDFEIEDENAIPRKFLMVDKVKIGAYVRAMKDQGQIAGVRIYSRTTVAVKG
jgi:hypothetical protein